MSFNRRQNLGIVRRIEIQHSLEHWREIEIACSEVGLTLKVTTCLTFREDAEIIKLNQ